MTGNFNDIPYPPDYGSPGAMSKSEDKIVEAMLKAYFGPPFNTTVEDNLLRVYRIARARVLDEAAECAKSQHFRSSPTYVAAALLALKDRTP